ncbi:MAG TPA: WD40 repeat domain-containing protein, partial [Gemmataceae bacterium]|nr:WD40 repeat domain-containing protein [Gemmataceae bacterium]
ISPPPDYCHDTAISPEGIRVARIEGGTVIFREVSDGRTLWQARYQKETSLSPCVRFDAAGSRVFVVAAHVSVLDAATGKELSGFDLTFGKYTTLNTAAVSPDGRWLATRHYDGLVVRDTADGRVVFTEPSMNYGDTLAFTPDGSRIAAGEYAGHRGGVHFWHVGGWGSAGALDPGIGTVTALAFSRDGLLGAAGGFYGQVAVWDMI